MTEMEKSLEVMMVVFQQYGTEHGDKKYLNKSQLKKLLEEQFPTFVKVRAFWIVNRVSVIGGNNVDFSFFFAL